MLAITQVLIYKYTKTDPTFITFAAIYTKIFSSQQNVQKLWKEWSRAAGLACEF